MAAVERATANFVERGQQIALENPDIEPEMIQAVEEVQNTGEAMSTSAREFLEKAADVQFSIQHGDQEKVGNSRLLKHCYGPYPALKPFVQFNISKTKIQIKN